MTNDSKTDALTAAQQAIAGVEWGAGSEHFRYGRETMQADAITAVGSLREQYPDARALTLDAMRLIADARQIMANEIAAAIEAKASDTSYSEPEAVTEHLLAAAGIARKLGGGRPGMNDSKQQKYEYQAALRYRDGETLERMGVSFNDEDYPDAKARALGEVWDIGRDPGVPEVVLVRRTIGEWELADQETQP